MIDHERKLIFIHIERTGGTSVEKALVGKDWWKIDSNSKHIKASQAKKLYGKDVWKDYTTFTIIRNPWDRVVSMYRTKWYTEFRKSNDNDPFYDFLYNLKNKKGNNPIKYCDILDLKVDYILRYENLNEDLNKMLLDLNYDIIELPHSNNTFDGVPYWDFYNFKSRILFNEKFRCDIDKYNYTFMDCHPRYMAVEEASGL